MKNIMPRDAMPINSTPYKVKMGGWIMTSPKMPYLKCQTPFKYKRHSTQTISNNCLTTQKCSSTLKLRRGSEARMEFHESNYLLNLSPREKQQVITEKIKRKEIAATDRFKYDYNNLQFVSPYRFFPSTEKKNKEISLAQNILNKYDKKFLEQNKRMKEYHVLWLTNLLNKIESEKANPDLLNIIKAKLQSDEFKKLFKMDKITSREEIYAEFSENLRTVLQRPNCILSSELRMQIKNILDTELRLSCAPETLLAKEMEYSKESDSKKTFNEQTSKCVNNLITETEMKIEGFKAITNKRLASMQITGIHFKQTYQK